MVSVPLPLLVSEPVPPMEPVPLKFTAPGLVTVTLEGCTFALTLTSFTAAEPSKTARSGLTNAAGDAPFSQGALPGLRSHTLPGDAVPFQVRVGGGGRVSLRVPGVLLSHM